MSRTPEQIAADRARYEEHQRKGLSAAPRALPPPSPRGTPITGEVLHSEIIPGGWYFSTKLNRGEAIRIALEAGPSAIAMIAWNAGDTSERLNLPDTIKVQWTTSVGKGRVLFTDMGRVMFSVIEDSSGAHDTLVGGSTAASNAEKYADQATRNSRDNFVLAAGKLGLTRRDIPSAISFFAPARVIDDDGHLGWAETLRQAGDFLDLRAEMDVLVALSNCPHPLDPNPIYAPNPVTVTRYRAEIAADDICRTASAEAIRGFENTDALRLGEGRA